MRIFFRYLCMELKKSFVILQKTIIFSIIGILLLLFGIIFLESRFQDKTVLEPVEIAVVIPKEESLIRLGAQYLSSMDSLESICNFNYMEEDIALEKLENNEVQAVIVFPENFYEDVYSGVNTPAVIYFSENTTLNVDLFRELLTDGVSMLQISEAGVYSVLKVTKTDRPEMKRSKIGDFVADKYIKALLDRGRVFDTYISSPYGKVNSTQYYYGVFMLLALLIYSVNFGFLYKRQERVLSEKLRMEGLGKIQLALIKTLVITTILWMIAVLIYIISYYLSEILRIYFIYWDTYVIFALWPMCLVIATYVNAVYIWCGNNVQGTTVLLMFNIIMVICAGIVIPSSYLPDGFLGLSKFIPATGWHRYCQMILFSYPEVKDILSVVLGIILFSGIGVVGIWKDSQHGSSSC